MYTHMKNNPSLFVLAGFILVIVVVGIYIYRPMEKTVPPMQTTPSPSAINDETGASFVLTDEEKEILTPQQVPTSDQQKRFQLLINRLAKEAPLLQIGKNCSVSPVVLKVKDGKGFSVKNVDVVPHTLFFPTNKYVVAAGQTQVIDAGVAKINNATGYTCDLPNKLAGFVVVFQ